MRVFTDGNQHGNQDANQANQRHEKKTETSENREGCEKAGRGGGASATAPEFAVVVLRQGRFASRLHRAGVRDTIGCSFVEVLSFRVIDRLIIPRAVDNISW